jgi:2,4-diketo-3-deoxy-L-fuconate hydrolase
VRLANLDGRLVLAREDGFIDVAGASGGRFGPDPQSVYERWAQFTEWAAGAKLEAGVEPELARLGPPVPSPRQVFAAAVNYRAPGAESPRPGVPVVFTKYPTCLVGPLADVILPSDRVDYEVELVVVIGRRAATLAAEHAWDHVAGVTVGQDLIDRELAALDPAGQLCLAKSFPGFGPIGPWVVTSDEPFTRGELELETVLSGARVQHDTTAAMIFGVPELIARISAICPLLPGDLIFTGTPSGIGMSQDPPRYLRDGDVLVSRIRGIGEITQRLRSRG